MNDYFDKMDSIPLHYYLHFMHASEIIGYKHPVEFVRKFWNEFYIKCVHKMHLQIETEEMLDDRLGDTISGWKKREV